MPKKFNYNKKLYSTVFMKVVVGVSWRLAQIYDYFIDRKVCGCSLVRYVPSLYRESRGATGSQSTPYPVLKRVFGQYEHTAEDHLIDVGCGKGRVLAHLVNQHFPGKLHGIELNQEVATYAQKWAKRYDNVEILSGDAFALDYNQYTKLFMGRPFLPDTFEQFIQKLERELTHPITLFYWVDQQSGHLLDGRPGWQLLRRRWIFKIKGFYMAACPQRYSVWVFTPGQS